MREQPIYGTINVKWARVLQRWESGVSIARCNKSFQRLEKISHVLDSQECVGDVEKRYKL